MNCVECDSKLVKAQVEVEFGFLTCWICDCSEVEYVEGSDVE